MTEQAGSGSRDDLDLDCFPDNSNTDGNLVEPTTYRDCGRCRRPQSVCLCSALPHAPLKLHGKLLVLQHPLEARKRMATVPLLDLCLKDCTLIRGRKFSVEKTSGLGDALHTAKQMGSPIYVLFPGAEARDLADMVRVHSQERHLEGGLQVQQAAAEPHVTHRGSHSPPWTYLLIAIDGTWRQGKEIFKVLMPLLEGFQADVVHLPLDSIPRENWECALKREPSLGCMTTAEAVARALGILEGSNEVQAALLAPLRQMTALQAAFDPATRARIDKGNEMMSISKRNFGFKMPKALIPA
ncbi:DTW domain-containing protein 2 [Coccomyxa sp. Obi]|nr:DTW domain-containing protein 2 [Coccomyxa sp. Obi]